MFIFFFNDAATTEIYTLSLHDALPLCLDPVELILVPHGCDSLQGLGSLLLDFAETPAPVETFYLPRGAGHKASLEFVQADRFWEK